MKPMVLYIMAKSLEQFLRCFLHPLEFLILKATLSLLTLQRDILWKLIHFMLLQET